MAYLFHLVLFLVLSSALLMLALRPAWREWRHPTDTLPLPVAANYSSEIDHFADEFREIALARMGGTSATTHQRFDFLPVIFNAADWKRARRPMISFLSVRTDANVRCKQPLFIAGNMDGGDGNHFKGLFVQGSLRLGANSEIVEWAHADGAMHFEAGCTALRRISSTVAVEMDKECCFERVQAPVIRMGVSPIAQPPVRADTVPVVAKFSDLTGAIHQTSTLTMVRGDCTLPAGRRYQGSLIVTGRLFIGAGTEIHGDVKARCGAVVGPHVRIEGSLISEKQIQIQERACIAGPVISETVILIGANCRLGLPLRPTTVSAENILAEAGSIAHGTVWARDLGVVWST